MGEIEFKWNGTHLYTLADYHLPDNILLVCGELSKRRQVSFLQSDQRMQSLWPKPRVTKASSALRPCLESQRQQRCAHVPM